MKGSIGTSMQGEIIITSNELSDKEWKRIQRNKKKAYRDRMKQINIDHPVLDEIALRKIERENRQLRKQ